MGLDSSTMHEDKQASSNKEDHSDFFDDDSNEDMEELVDDEQGNCSCTITHGY